MLSRHKYALKHAFITFLLHMQIPNFMLALPMLYISFAGCFEYFSQDWIRSMQLGLLSRYPSSTFGTRLQSQETAAPKHPQSMAAKALCNQEPKGFNSNGVAPYIHQWAVMTACALFVMNVQVATRYVTMCHKLSELRLTCVVSPLRSKCD